MRPKQIAMMAKLIVLSAFAFRLTSATVEGTVVDDHQNPIAGARVKVLNLMQPTGGVTIEVKTNRDGYFKLDGIAPGDYQVFVRKEEMGYGDTSSALYAAGRPAAPLVKLANDSDSVKVNVDIGKPGGILTLTVLDNNTENPITTARVRLTLLSDTALWDSNSVSERGVLTLPLPLVPYTIGVSAPGFIPQPIVDLHAEPGEKKNVVVKLKRATGQ
jgi:hypothetical protein